MTTPQQDRDGRRSSGTRLAVGISIDAGERGSVAGDAGHQRLRVHVVRARPAALPEVDGDRSSIQRDQQPQAQVDEPTFSHEPPPPQMMMQVSPEQATWTSAFCVTSESSGSGSVEESSVSDSTPTQPDMAIKMVARTASLLILMRTSCDASICRGTFVGVWRISTSDRR